MRQVAAAITTIEIVEAGIRSDSKGTELQLNRNNSTSASSERPDGASIAESSNRAQLGRIVELSRCGLARGDGSVMLAQNSACDEV
jgi:hypothetical protein